jgi:MFS family permease
MTMPARYAAAPRGVLYGWDHAPITLRARSPRTLPGMRKRDIRLIVAAVGVSAFGDFLLWVPMALHIQSSTGSPLAVSAFFLALFGPMVVLGGVAGRLADRFENAHLLRTVSLAQAVAVAAMALATGSLAATLALTVLVGIGAAVAQPAEFALVPVAAGERRLAAVNGWVETARYAGMTLGPPAGGLLAGTGHVEIALAVDALTFAAVALAATLLHARRRPERAIGDSGRAREGFAVLARDPVLRVTLATAVLALVFFSMSMTAEVFYIKEVLGASDATFGVLFTAWAGGMVAGAVALARRVPQGAIALAAVAAVAVQGAGLAGAAAGALAAAFAGFALGGVAHGVKNVLMRTLIHERVPESLRGRAFALYNAARNGAELGALALGGALVGAVGAQTALLLSGAIPLAIGVAALLFITTPTRRTYAYEG